MAGLSPRQVASVAAPRVPSVMNDQEIIVEDAKRNGRLCPWCTGYLTLTNTALLGPTFICADEFHKGCSYYSVARWASGKKMGYRPQESARPGQR